MFFSHFYLRFNSFPLLAIIVYFYYQITNNMNTYNIYFIFKLFFFLLSNKIAFYVLSINEITSLIKHDLSFILLYNVYIVPIYYRLW